MIWAMHIAFIVKTRNAYNILVENLRRGDYLENLGIDGKVTLKWRLGI
jgi:hypothetical protein